MSRRGVKTANFTKLASEGVLIGECLSIIIEPEGTLNRERGLTSLTRSADPFYQLKRGRGVPSVERQASGT